jgi:hypothetical protein
MRPVNVRPARVSISIDSACVATSSRFRFHRSTAMPANGMRANAGTCDAKPTTPSSRAEPVRRYTSQLVAVIVIQVPHSETIWPPKKRR